MAQHIIVRAAGNHVTVQNKLPGVFQVQNFLHIAGRHAGHFPILYDFLGLGKGCGNPLQDSLVINIRFHIGSRKGKIACYTGGKLPFRITWCSKLLFYAAKFPANFAGFSGIAEKQIMQLFRISSNIGGSLFAGYTLSDIEILPGTSLLDFRSAVIGHQIKSCLKVSTTSEQFLYFMVMNSHQITSIGEHLLPSIYSIAPQCQGNYRAWPWRPRLRLRRDKVIVHGTLVDIWLYRKGALRRLPV